MSASLCFPLLIPECLLTTVALPANIGIYEKSHDCAERVTAIVYNLMRNGVPFKRATEQINESLTKSAEKIYPINPQLVSSQYFSLEAARYCEKHFLGKPAPCGNPWFSSSTNTMPKIIGKTKEGDINRKFFLKGIADFGELLPDEEYKVRVDDMSYFYYDFCIRRSYPEGHFVEKQSLEEGGGHSKKRHLAEEDKEGNKQPIKKRAVENEKGTSKTGMGGKAPSETSTGKNATGKTTACNTSKILKKMAKNTVGKQYIPLYLPGRRG